MSFTHVYLLILISVVGLPISSCHRHSKRDEYTKMLLIKNWTVDKSSRRNEILRSKYAKPVLQKEGNQSAENVACYDSRLLAMIQNAVHSYPHHMDYLASHLLTTIGRSYPGFWTVHAQKTYGHAQGADWQTRSTSQIFQGRDPYGCFYYDQYHYVLVNKVY